ncbi:alpha/beta fold hydrolase [Halobacteriaceae archaeon GCM10025711]
MTPFAFLADVQRQVGERAVRAWTSPLVAPDRLARMATAEVGSTPSEVVHRENKLRVHRYEPLVERRHATPIFVVYALINRPYILDLQPDRSVVRRFLEAGFDVYLLDWGEPSRLDAHLTLADYVTRYLANAVDAVCETAGTEQVHLFGYCSSATLNVMYAALHPGPVRTLGLLAPLLNFDADGGLFRFWSEDGYDRARMADVFGNVPWQLLTLEFSMVQPFEYYVGRQLRLAASFDDSDAVGYFARRNRWTLDGVDVAGDAFREFVHDLYRNNRLLAGDLTLDGKRVDVGDIEMPVLLILGEHDEFIPAEAGLPFLDAVGSDDADVVTCPVGHVDLSVATAAHADLWPRVCAWFAARSDGDSYLPVP